MNLTKKIFLILLFIGNITYSQDWIKTHITDFTSINFPVQSKLNETTRETVFTAKDDFGFYIVSIRKLTDQQSSRIIKEEIPNLYQGFANGAIEAISGKIISKNEITILGIPALEMEYYAPANLELPSQRYKRIIYVNQNIISVDFLPLTNQESIVNEKKAKFFNSFSINSSEIKNTIKVTNNNSNKTNTVSESGFFVGQGIFYIILIAFLIGLFLLIRYLIKKNENKNFISHTAEQPQAKTTKITCKKCDSENNPNTKYCTRCGFELPKN